MDRENFTVENNAYECSAMRGSHDKQDREEYAGSSPLRHHSNPSNKPVIVKLSRLQ